MLSLLKKFFQDCPGNNKKFFTQQCFKDYRMFCLYQGWANYCPQQPFLRPAKALNKYFKKIIVFCLQPNFWSLLLAITDF